ncbi:17471_t:CDS:2, partial [Acaulospora morrowiae]
LHSVATHGTSSSHGYGLRLRYYSYPWNFVFAWLWTSPPLLALVTHGTSSSHGYGLRLHYSQLVESKKMGRIYNFWLKLLPESKHHDLMKNEKINAENVFSSCDLSRGVQIGGTGNIIQEHRQSYVNHEQTSVEVVIPTKR